MITHNLPPWKTGATQLEWTTGIKVWNLHENTEAIGFMSSLFYYCTQITPSENGDHTVWMDYKEKNPNFERKHQGDGFDGKAHFPAITTLMAGFHYYFCSEPLSKRGFDVVF